MRHDSPSLFASKERKASLEVPGSAGNEEHEGPSKAETMQAEHVSPAPTQSNDVKEALGMTPVVEEAEHDEPSVSWRVIGGKRHKMPLLVLLLATLNVFISLQFVAHFFLLQSIERGST